MQSESVLADVTTRLSVSITALGQTVRKATVPLITSTPTSSCSATEINELQPVRFTALHEYKDRNRLIVGHLRQSSRSSGNSGARLKTNRNAWRGQNGLMLCAQSHHFGIPRNLMSGSPTPSLMGRDTIFTVLESLVLRWSTSLPVAKRRRDIR